MTPTNQPISLRVRIKVEWSTWASLAFAAALMEGGVIGILIKNGFQNQVDTWLLNSAVAIATGAPFFSNLLSFFWVKLSQGKSKAVFVSNLAVVFCLCTFLMSFVSFTPSGLIILLVILIIARVAWSGILTIRSNIWRANYPRYIRGKVTAKLATLSALLMSLASLAVGWVLDWQFESFRWLFICFSCLSLIGAYRYRCLAVRNQHKEISREKNSDNKRSMFKVFSLLKENKAFGKYMLAMFILGSGNLMFMAPLIVFINEHSSLNPLEQIMITTAIPLALIPVAVGWWARLLDGNHIFYFRSIHSWGFVIALAMFLTAQVANMNSLFYIAAFFYGVAISGGVIGWNLGHNDFVNKSTPVTSSNMASNSSANLASNLSANPESSFKSPSNLQIQQKMKSKAINENPMDYMAIHVTLTGVRGLLMPLIGIFLYQWLEGIQVGNGKYALILPLTMTTLGAVLFVVFNIQNKNNS